MGAPKAPETPTVIQDPKQMEGAKKHKDHYHDAQGNKFYGNAQHTTIDTLVPHKDHFHDKETGVKTYGQPNTKEGLEHSEHPDEEDMVEESVTAQRRTAKKNLAKTSSINTMLQSTGGAGAGTRQGHRLG